MTWKSVPLESVAEIQLGKMLSGKASKGESPAPYLRNANVQWGRLVLDDLLEMDFSHREREKFSLIPGDLIVCEGGEPGRCAVVTEPMRNIYYQKALMRVRPQPERLTPQFLQRFMQHAASRGVFRQGGNQSTIAHFPALRLRALQVPLPPLLEQKCIAAILDATDALRAKRRESIKQLDSLIQATFLEMFGDPVTNPKGWDPTALQTLATRITKGASPKWQGFDYVDNGVLFVTSENVRDGYLSIEPPKFVPQAFHTKLRGSQLANGDLLINLVGASIGRSALFQGYSGPANVNQAVGVVSLQNSTLARYILCALQTSAGKTLLTGNIVEAARANISLKNLRDIQIPLPPLAMQTRFASIVESIEQHKGRMKAHLADLDTLFASLQSRAFNGELMA